MLKEIYLLTSIKMNPNINTITLTSKFKPKVDINTLRKQETQNMFKFLPVLRNQTQFKNIVGYMPNREMNAVIDQAKLNSIINNHDGTRVYPSGSYKYNFFPTKY
jgi:hypothetical protein